MSENGKMVLGTKLMAKGLRQKSGTQGRERQGTERNQVVVSVVCASAERGGGGGGGGNEYFQRSRRENSHF